MVEIFDSLEQYLNSLPKDKAKAYQGYRKNPNNGQFYKLIKAKDVQKNIKLPCGS